MLAYLQRPPMRSRCRGATLSSPGMSGSTDGPNSSRVPSTWQDSSPNYQDTITTVDHRPLGIADCLVPQQGRTTPGQAVAALAGRCGAGPRAPRCRPMWHLRRERSPWSRTRHWRLPARRLPVPGSTSSSEYGELPDGRDAGARSAQPRRRRTGCRLANPMDLFSAAANHGGLWTVAYEPRSVLRVAAAMECSSTEPEALALPWSHRWLEYS